MQLPKSKPVGGAMTRHGGTPWSRGGAVLPCLQGLCWGQLFSLPITVSHFALIHLTHECKTLLPWLTEWSVNGCGAGGEQQCFSGLKAALVSCDHGLIIAGGNLALANAPLKSSAVRVLKHFRIILPTIWGVLQSRAIRHQRRSLSK